MLRIGCTFVLLVSVIAAAEISEGIPYLLAGLDDLASYPQPLSAERVSVAERIYAITLPETERVVLLRPILETEYGSFQVQAIAPELIDAQMLAAAIILRPCWFRHRRAGRVELETLVELDVQA